MWTTPFRYRSGKQRKVSHQKCCLLIGNTRWHWAIQEKKQWHFIHTPPNTNTLKEQNCYLWKWASVGPMPKNFDLDPAKSIKIKNVPLLKLPNWIGIDRALVGWAAFQKAKANNNHSHGVLIADAGTVLSITRITANGEFAGGQLVAGLQLQLNAMSSGTQNLTEIKEKYIPIQNFPISTNEAMLKGSFQALLGVLLDAQRKANMPLWLCGGDSELFFNHLQTYNLDIHHHPNLVLEAMIKIHS